MSLMSQNAKVKDSLLDNEKPFSSFDLGLDVRLTKALNRLNFVYASLVQVHCIPLAMQGKDLLVKASTGSGKTAAFALPLLQKILDQKDRNEQQSVQALVLVPTKELVAQTKKHIVDLMYYCKDIISILALGGESISAQQALLRDVPDILVATPGRLLKHLEAKNVFLKKSVHTLVMDEADLLLSFGYGNDIRAIFTHLPKACQSFLMSATLSPELNLLKKGVLHNPAVVKLEDGEKDGKLQQFFVNVDQIDKDMLLYSLIKLGIVRGKVIFFVNSVETAYRLKLFFEQFFIKAAVLNAQLPSNSRQHIIEEFNRGIFDYLIATDESIDKDEEDSESEESDNEDTENRASDDAIEKVVDNNDEEESDSNSNDASDNDDSDSENENENEKPNTKNTKKSQKDAGFGVSRGVDFHGVNFVVNVDFPKSVKSYIHRVGRTARGRASGTALSLVANESEEDTKVLSRVQSKQKPVTNDTDEDVQQPAPLTFDVKEIDCFRYRVEDVRRAVTAVAVREAQIRDVKKEIMNSEKLKSHFEDNPKDLNILQHDKSVGKARVQPHLATIPSYLVPLALQAQPSKKKRARRKSQSGRNQKRRTDNDPLHTFEHTEDVDDQKLTEDSNKTQTNEDRITYGDDGVGTSTAGRQRWKEQHRKGRFNPRTIAKKKKKQKYGFSH